VLSGLVGLFISGQVESRESLHVPTWQQRMVTELPIGGGCSKHVGIIYQKGLRFAKIAMENML
jgi:hypothetical protein